jgi:hypothetical protein
VGSGVGGRRGLGLAIGCVDWCWRWGSVGVEEWCWRWGLGLDVGLGLDLELVLEVWVVLELGYDGDGLVIEVGRCWS